MKNINKETLTEFNILGQPYTFSWKDYDEDPEFETKGIGGYCDMILKNIVVCNMDTYPGYETSSKEFIDELKKELLRHEIIHAFLYESGLNQSSMDNDAGWATNEEMVDWFAIQSPKIFKLFSQLEIL